MKRYDKEFKKEVIKRYMGGATIAALARETGVNEQTLHKWKNELVRTDEGEVDKERLLTKAMKVSRSAYYARTTDSRQVHFVGGLEELADPLNVIAFHTCRYIVLCPGISVEFHLESRGG